MASPSVPENIEEWEERLSDLYNEKATLGGIFMFMLQYQVRKRNRKKFSEKIGVNFRKFVQTIMNLLRLSSPR